MSDFLTTQQAADKYGVTRRAIQKWIDHGKLPAVKFGRDYMIPADVEKPKDLRYVENPIRNRRKSPV